MALAEEEIWFENMISAPARSTCSYRSQIYTKTLDTRPQRLPIGNTAFISILEIDRCAEIGIMLGEKSW
jgi:hypothetical protein